MAKFDLPSSFRVTYKVVGWVTKQAAEQACYFDHNMDDTDENSWPQKNKIVPEAKWTKAIYMICT